MSSNDAIKLGFAALVIYGVKTAIDIWAEEQNAKLLVTYPDTYNRPDGNWDEFLKIGSSLTNSQLKIG